MGLESGTFIADLVQSNPPTSDQETQGANHLQLIKKVLQQTLLNANKAWSFPYTVAKSANYAILKADINATFLCDTTGGAFTLTLPSGLVAGDAGWSVGLLKTNSGVNPVFWAPASGTMQSGEIGGLSLARRCIPGRETRAIWTGTGWILTRVPSEPIGAVLPVCGLASKALPVGYEWPNGQTLASVATNYPEYNSKYATGITVDMRGRSAFCRDDIGGVAAARLTTAVAGNIDGTIPNNSGGSQSQTLVAAHLPTITPTTSSFSLTASVASVSGDIYKGSTVFTENQGAGTANANVPKDGGYGNISASGAVTGTITMNSFGSNAAHTILPPAIILDYVLVVE